MLKTIPGLILIFFEICLLTAVSVAISTRVPMVVNMVTCFAIFVVGHITSVMVERGVLQIELVQFTAKLLATALPNLEHFNTEAGDLHGRAGARRLSGLCRLVLRRLQHGGDFPGVHPVRGPRSGLRTLVSIAAAGDKSAMTKYQRRAAHGVTTHFTDGPTTLN